MRFTPFVRDTLAAMPAKQAAAFMRYFRTIEACEGDHAESWPSSVPQVWVTEFDGRTIRYSRPAGSGPRPISVSAIF